MSAPAADGSGADAEAPVLVHPGESGESGVPAWAGRVRARVVGADTLAGDGRQPSRAPGSGAAVLAQAGFALVDAATPGFVRVARRLHTVDASLQVVAVAPPEALAAARRALLHAPGLGEVWLATPGELTAAFGERAAGVTRQRRRFERTRTRLERERQTASPQRAERALVSDAYLAGLLEVLPDAVCSVDAAGRVLSANAAAERRFGGAGRPPVVGARLAAAFGLEDVPPGAELALLDRATREGAVAVTFRDAAGARGAGELRAAAVGRAGAAGAPAADVWAVVLHDVTEQRATLDALRARTREAEAARADAEHARADAERANAAKSQFLATMSHELRTPLNAIGGYTQLLELGLHGPVTAAQTAALARVQAAQRRLLGLINDVLNFAKLEAGRVEYALGVVDLRAVVADVAPLVEPQLAAKGLALEVRLPERPCAAWADREKLGQVLLNLLSNAAKFTDARHPATGAPGRVTVDVATRPAAAVAGGAAAPAGDAILLRVTDTGAGIPRDKQAAVFEPFVQLATGYARTGDGTGLGLAISRDLARGMGGELTVESTPGVGSTFTLTLPRA